MAVSIRDLTKPGSILLTSYTDYPAYELYTDVLRKGIFHQTGKQLRLVVNKQRRVEEVEIQ
jgi:hypothetical protein